MGAFDSYGMGESALRDFLERELAKIASTTSFYWESEELEEALDVIVDAVARTIAENNRRFSEDMRRNILRDAHFR